MQGTIVAVDSQRVSPTWASPLDRNFDFAVARTPVQMQEDSAQLLRADGGACAPSVELEEGPGAPEEQLMDGGSTTPVLLATAIAVLGPFMFGFSLGCAAHSQTQRTHTRSPPRVAHPQSPLAQVHLTRIRAAHGA